jgi:hypothetical protein
MRRRLASSLLASLILASALATAPASAIAQCPTNFANITAAQIGANTPLQTGKLSVTATDSSHNPINFTVPGSGIGLMRAWTRNVVNGAITLPLCLPRTDRTSSPVGYHFQIRDTSAGGGNAIVLDQYDVAILADTWSLDTYSFLPQRSPYTLAANIAPWAGPIGPPGPAGSAAALVDSVTGAIYIIKNGALVTLAGNASYQTLASSGGSLFSLRLYGAVPTLVPVSSTAPNTVILTDQSAASTYWSVTVDNQGGVSLAQVSSSTGALASLPIVDTGDGVTKLLSISNGAPALSY